MDNDASIALYSKLLANSGAAYAATQEAMKTQATTMAAMQGQLTNIQQFWMAVSQQPPPNIYAPPQQQQRPQQCPLVAYYPIQGTAQSGSGTYRVRATMPMPAQQPSQGMMNYVGQQYPPNAANTQMMQQPTQQGMSMMAPYYAPNQQPYYAPNQQQPGYF